MYSQLLITKKWIPKGFLYHLFGIRFALITGLCCPLFIFLSKPIITCNWPLVCVKFVPWYQAWDKYIRGRWIGTRSWSGTLVWCWWDERCGAVKHFSAPLIYHCHEGRGKRLSSAEARELHGSCWLIAFFPFGASFSQPVVKLCSAHWQILQRCL